MKLVGVLDLQGDVSEHVSAIKEAAAGLGRRYEIVRVKRKNEVKAVDALVVPGGESTTIGKLLKKYDINEEIKKLAEEGKPIFGTCAGLILLGCGGAYSLGIMDVHAKRNAFGRQKESFEAEVSIPALGKKPYHAVFIRAPYIEKAEKKVEVLAEYKGKIVAARQKNLLAAAFHPELTADRRFEEYFLGMM
jgi:5'-phosphate synthase pdxT subunit